MECIFCRIISREVPSEVLYEDEMSFAVLDANPCAPGHALILPKAHVNSVIEIDDAHLGPVFHTVKRIVGMLKASLNPDGFTIGINHGRAAGQAIDHLHVHVIPRWANDGGGSIHTVVTHPSSETLPELAKKIRKG